MASTAKWTAYNAADTLMQGASMNALANAAYASSAQNSGTPIDNTTLLALYMDIILTLSSAVTAGSGSAYVSVWLVPSLDGTNYPNPPGTSAIAPPTGLFVGNIAAVAGASFTSGVLRGVVIPPGKFHIVIQNNLGVALPATNTSTLQGYRYGEQAV